MIPLNFKDVADHRHFPPDADLWDIGLIFRLEKKCIDDHLLEQAGESWRKQKVSGAMLGWAALTNDILGSYLTEERARLEKNKNIWESAKSGQLKKEAPTTGQIRKVTALLVLSVIAESSVMLVQVLFDPDNFNIFAIVFALMLAVGGILQGWGVGPLLAKHWRAKTGRPLPGESSLAEWIKVGVGTVIILAIAALRSSNAFEPLTMFLTFGVTLLFGEVVALFEALREYYKAQRGQLLNDMHLAQGLEAHILHSAELERDGYRTTYEEAVKKADRTGRPISEPEKSQTPSPSGYPSPSDTSSTGGSQ